MELNVTWVSTAQKDGRFSALAIREEVIFDDIINTQKGFIRRAKAFKLGEVIVVPEEYDAMVIDKEWSFVKC